MAKTFLVCVSFGINLEVQNISAYNNNSTIEHPLKDTSIKRTPSNKGQIFSSQIMYEKGDISKQQTPLYSGQ